MFVSRKLKHVLVMLFIMPVMLYANNQPNTILLGVSNATSGPASQLGTKLNDGANAYFRKINANGGVSGYRINMLQLDDSYEPYLTKKNTQKFLEREDVFALFNYVGTPTSYAIWPKLIQDNVLYFTPFTGANFLRDTAVNNVVNVRASYYAEVEAHIDFLVNEKGIKKIGILAQADQFGSSVIEDYIQAMNRHKIEPIITTRFRRNTSGVDWALKKLIASEVEAVAFVGTYKPLAELINMANEQQFTPYFTTVSFVSSADLFVRIKAPSNLLVSEVMPDPNHCETILCLQFKEDMAEQNIFDLDRVHLEGYINAYVFAHLMAKCQSSVSTSCIQQQATKWFNNPQELKKQLPMLVNTLHQKVYLNFLNKPTP